VGRIRDEILAAPHARITFARFMQRALTEPGVGYYASSALRPTRRGDFLTAPELHPFFGRCLGRFLEAAWARLGKPVRLDVREYGSGRGTLRDTVAEGLRAEGADVAAVIDWHGIDVPPRGEARADGDFRGVVLANEFLDALPVHRLAMQKGSLTECYVTWRDGWFSETRGSLSDERLAAPLRAEGVELAEGQRAEVCPAAADWLRAEAADLRDGIILVIDYGHEAAELYSARRMAGSLVTYREHQAADDPFMNVGLADMTAHVDISALGRAADEASLTSAGSTTQARFLSDLGLGEMLGTLGRDPDTSSADYVAARASVARLLDPRHLGGFRVLAWERHEREAVDGDLAGFGAGTGSSGSSGSSGAGA